MKVYKEGRKSFRDMWLIWEGKRGCRRDDGFCDLGIYYASTFSSNYYNSLETYKFHLKHNALNTNFITDVI